MSVPRITRENLTKLVEGQIRSFLNDHPTAVREYWLADVDGKPRIVNSLSKRVTGEVWAWLTQKKEIEK